jgi:molecular chaperone DnaK (HSP70)
VLPVCWRTTLAVVAVVCLMLDTVSARTELKPLRKGLAIDWGTEWLKMARVAPAGTQSMQAVEVVVDEQSERRTPALVAFDPPPASTGRLLVGNAAARVAARRPDAVLPALKRLMGASLRGDDAATPSSSYASSDYAHHFVPPRALVAVR